MNRVTAIPAIGSPSRKPSDTATRPASAPAEDRASSQECRASATSVADFMRLPTTSLYRATTWFPTMPSAAPTMPRATWLVGGAVIDELADALVPGERLAGPDDHGDADPGQVFGPVQAVGVPLGRPLAGEPESQEHHHAGGHVGQ